MPESKFIDTCITWLLDKGLFSGFFFVATFGAILKMDNLFGYPLDGPHKFVMLLVLLFVSVYGHYSLKAIRTWYHLKNPKSYNAQVFEDIRKIRERLFEYNPTWTSSVEWYPFSEEVRRFQTKIPREHKRLFGEILTLANECLFFHTDKETTRNREPREQDVDRYIRQSDLLRSKIQQFEYETEWVMR